MALKFYEKYQIMNLIEHLKVIYPNELDDSMIESLKKDILENGGDFSSLTEEIRSLFEYDTNKLQIFLIKHHVTIKGNLEISFKKKKENFIKKIGSLNKKGMGIKRMVIGTLIPILLSGYIFNYSIGNQIGRFSTVVPTSTSMEEFIEQSVNENKNLEEEERDALKKFETYLAENPYINEKMIYYNLKNLDINYKTKTNNSYVKGLYIPRSNKIYIYNSETRSDEENRMALGHEIFHSLSSVGSGSGFHTMLNHKGGALTEGMTQILTEEYLLGQASGETMVYQEETALVKIIAELVGADVLLYGYSNQDINIVIEKLGELDGNVNKANTLIKLTDKLSKVPISNEKEYQECKAQIYAILQEYYQLKVKENPEKAPILTYLIEIFYAQSVKAFYYDLHKAYFSEKLKELEPYLICKGGEEGFKVVREIGQLLPTIDKPLIMLQNDMPIGELANGKMQRFTT